MFAAEHTDFDAKAFLVLHKRLVILALRFIDDEASILQ